MQAIITKYHPPGTSRGARISAKCARGSVTIDYPHHLARDARFRAAALALVSKFIKEDEAKRGEPRATNPWARRMVGGELPDGREVFVFVTDDDANKGDGE